jgi:hypothetical protein
MVDLWGIEFDLHELILTQLEHGTFCKIELGQTGE